METVIDRIRKTVTGVSSDIEELLLTKSGTHEVNSNFGDIVVLNANGDQWWNPLDDEGRKIQSKVYGEYNKFSSLMAVLLRDQPKKSQREFEKAKKTIFKIIEQDGVTYHKDMKEALKSALNALEQQINEITSLYSFKKATIFVPDTNALISNPSIESWQFSETDKFEIILTSTVLSELDHLKIYHGNQAVREKAQTIIRKIKEYRRRGDLNNGVPIISGKITISAMALEPKFEETLPWFDPENNDDRVLASFIEIMRNHLDSPVILVTNDINLQNKADYANIPFLEPPEAD